MKTQGVRALQDAGVRGQGLDLSGPGRHHGLGRMGLDQRGQVVQSLAAGPNHTVPAGWLMEDCSSRSSSAFKTGAPRR